MKQLIATIHLIAFFSTAIFAQKKEEINFSDPFQIDSSAYFLIPRLVDDVNKDAYGKGKGYLPWGNYSASILEPGQRGMISLKNYHSNLFGFTSSQNFYL